MADETEVKIEAPVEEVKPELTIPNTKFITHEEFNVLLGVLEDHGIHSGPSLVEFYKQNNSFVE